VSRQLEINSAPPIFQTKTKPFGNITSSKRRELSTKEHALPRSYPFLNTPQSLRRRSNSHPLQYGRIFNNSVWKSLWPLIRIRKSWLIEEDNPGEQDEKRFNHRRTLFGCK
jgi:hypothetical protein